MLKYTFCFISLFYQIGFTQPDKLKIQKIFIHDDALRLTIIKYINENLEENKLFNAGIGYLTISNIENIFSSGRPINEVNFTPTQKSLDLNIKAFPLLTKNDGTCISCNHFPLYYTLIQSKIILIYADNIFGLFGKNNSNQLDNRIFFKNSSLKKMSKLIRRKALKELPNDFVFNDFLEPNISFIELRKKSKKKNMVYNFYEFLDFKALQKVKYNFKSNNWEY